MHRGDAEQIVWVNTPAKLTAADVDRILLELEHYLDRGIPYVLLFDLSGGLPDALQRKKLIAHMNGNVSSIERWVRGLGVVVPSAVARNLVTAILWFAPQAMPQRLFESRADAQTWAEELERQGALR